MSNFVLGKCKCGKVTQFNAAEGHAVCEDCHDKKVVPGAFEQALKHMKESQKTFDKHFKK